MHTDWHLSWRYDENHRRHTPLTPISSWSLRSRIWWSIVSKAAERSSSISITACFLSSEHTISLWTLSRAVSTLWLGLYDCMHSCRLFAERWAFSLADIKLCNVLTEFMKRVKLWKVPTRNCGFCAQCRISNRWSWIIMLMIIGLIFSTSDITQLVCGMSAHLSAQEACMFCCTYCVSSRCNSVLRARNSWYFGSKCYHVFSVANGILMR